MDRIIRARDYAQREGVRSVVERIARISAQMVARRLLDTPFVGGAPVGKPVVAEINHGQWIAYCECGGAEAVDPTEPIFYCFNCGNRATKGRLRAVAFPLNIEEIEAILLERLLEDGGGANEIDRVFLARPLVGVVNGEPVVMHRSWLPGETMDDLRTQNALIPILQEQMQAAATRDLELTIKPATETPTDNPEEVQ
jgi:hypothetical protein